MGLEPEARSSGHCHLVAGVDLHHVPACPRVCKTVPHPAKRTARLLRPGMLPAVPAFTDGTSYRRLRQGPRKELGSLLWLLHVDYRCPQPSDLIVGRRERTATLHVTGCACSGAASPSAGGREPI